MDINARVLWEDFVINMNDTADWNSDMKEVKVKNKPILVRKVHPAILGWGRGAGARGGRGLNEI